MLEVTLVRWVTNEFKDTLNDKKAIGFPNRNSFNAFSNSFSKGTERDSTMGVIFCGGENLFLRAFCESFNTHQRFYLGHLFLQMTEMRTRHTFK